MAITGLGVLSGVGVGPERLAAALAAGRAEPSQVGGLFEDEPLPSPVAHALADFRVRDHLGRKGTSFFDRNTSLGLVACQAAFADSELAIDNGNRDRIGITLGTTHASLKSTSDYSRETFVQERPFMVNPLQFPNAVMNCTAGQAGIWFGLKGPNTTIAGGPVALLQVLRHSRVQIGCGYADALLAGAMEELSPQSAWAVHDEQRTEGGTLPAGEGAAVFVLEDAATVRAAGRTMDAEVLAVELGSYDPPSTVDGNFTAGLTGCLTRALAAAGVTAAQISTVAACTNGMALLDLAEDAAIQAVLPGTVSRLHVKEITGEAGAASGAFQLAALLARHRAEPERDGELSVITTRSADGAAGAAVVRGWSRP